MDTTKTKANTAQVEPEVDAVDATDSIDATDALGGDTYTHKFKTPFSYNGKAFDELTFDWGKLMGRDALSISNEMAALGLAVAIPTFSVEYHIRIAAKACTEKIGSDAFTSMPLRDFNKITVAARNFLLS